MNEKPTIYLYGTFHSSEKSKRDIRNIFNRYKIDAVLIEGVDDRNQKTFQNEPFLAIFLWIYFKLLTKMGSEFGLAKELANKSNIYIKYMDKSENELVEYFHKPYNNIIVFLIIVGILLIFNNSIILLLSALFVLGILYLFYFALKTWNFREDFFYENIKETIENNPYNSVLILCGKYHTNFIKKKFDCIDLTKSF
ncbi:MAG: hypothetical protein KKC23_02650 [Proteobacteria bacterium]|nr:hypothetical protein [Pseudomonadota bacterium]